MPFETIIGNQKVKELLLNCIEQERIVHSYLFIGEEGIGKKLFATEYAKMALCLNKKNTSECQCKSCLEIKENNHPDYYEIEPEGNSIKIDKIRQIQSKVIEKPIISEKKVYIIDHADAMTTEAQNCLLKTLEEPPEYMIIILITSNENAILNTIKSRCMKVNFQPLSDDEIRKALKEKLGMENISRTMLNIFQGSLQKVFLLKDKQDIYIKIDKIFGQLEHTDQLEFLMQTEELYKSKEEIMEILEYLNVIFLQKAKEKINMREKYIHAIEIVEETKKRIKANSNYDMSIDFLLFGIWEAVN